jgi:phosphoglycolate phosphatase
VRDLAVIRQLIFDLDGTLVDSCSVCVHILSGMLTDRGSDHTIDPVTARPWMSVGGAAMVSALLGPACTDPDRDVAEFRARYQELLTPPQTLFDGVAESLEQLRAVGFTLSICSNKPQNLCDKVLADTGIAPLFDTVVGLRPELRRKPAPDMLLATMSALDASPSQCLYIGDSEIDHQVASQVGVPFVFMSYGYAEPAFRHEQADSFDCFQTMSKAIVTRLAPARAA